MIKKEYRYRRHIKWGQYAIALFFGALTIGSLGIPVISTIIKGSVPEHISIFLVLPLS